MGHANSTTEERFLSFSVTETVDGAAGKLKGLSKKPIEGEVPDPATIFDTLFKGQKTEKKEKK